MLSNQKIAAIYDLREAVENKVLAEQALDEKADEATRAALLDATLVLEEKTQLAIDICHACGHAHESGSPHQDAVQSDGGKVISVDFRPHEGENDGRGRI